MAMKPHFSGALCALLVAVLSLSARGQNPQQAQGGPVPQESTVAVVRTALQMPGADTARVAAYGCDELLACLRLGAKPAQWMADDKLEIWSVEEREASENGWVVFFNRQTDRPLAYVLGHVELGLPTCPGNYELTDALTGSWMPMGREVRIAPSGVLVVRYRSLD